MAYSSDAWSQFEKHRASELKFTLRGSGDSRIHSAAAVAEEEEWIQEPRQQYATNAYYGVPSRASAAIDIPGFGSISDDMVKGLAIGAGVGLLLGLLFGR